MLRQHPGWHLTRGKTAGISLDRHRQSRGWLADSQFFIDIDTTRGKHVSKNCILLLLLLDHTTMVVGVSDVCILQRVEFQL